MSSRKTDNGRLPYRYNHLWQKIVSTSYFNYVFCEGLREVRQLFRLL